MSKLILAARYDIPAGTTSKDFELRDNGQPFDGTGHDIELVISTTEGDDVVAPEEPPEADWLEQADGTVRVTGLDNLAIGNYYVRYKLTKDGEVAFIPNEKVCDVWAIGGIPRAR